MAESFFEEEKGKIMRTCPQVEVILYLPIIINSQKRVEFFLT